MAIAHTLPHRGSPAESAFRSPGPYGLPWLVAGLFSEAMFVFCRAAAQGSFSVDDAACWIAGLTPFIIQFSANRFFSVRSASLVEVWMLALATHLILQLSDVAHFVEYPINLRLDLGLGGGLVTASVYIALALVPLLTLAMVREDRVVRARSYASTALIAIPCMAIALFLQN